MEKNITLQQSDIRVINAKQVQTSALLDGMKKAATVNCDFTGTGIYAGATKKYTL